MNEAAIAVVGLAGRYPGAHSPREFWRNVRGGIESIRRYGDDELREAGVSEEILQHPRYVKAGAPLDDMELFDAEFFGFSPKDAAIMDPQHRHFLEVAWEALEDAGHPPERFGGPIGVWAGCGMNAYMMFHLLTNPDLMASVGLFLVRHTGNDKDFLATRVSYEFDLRGPSVSVQTACSTSLVAVHMACQSLLNGEVDMALAGGVTIELPHRQGYLYEPGEILSPDGHCRAFDHRSKGTVFGSGAGVAVLRRLEDALADGDHVYAVVLGSAVNNDGSGKVGYLAPSVDGQAAAIAEALSVAEVDADTIGYVETHGTGTPVGDPIEIAALTQAFRATSERKGFCAIGSVKTNIGHLDTAAGIASLTKAAFALGAGELPPSLHFEAPNPSIQFDASPFFVNRELRAWAPDAGPRRAGVSSLGVGGTNAHVILEEAPAPDPPAPSARPWQVLPLSARSGGALDEGAARLAAHLRAHPDLPIADVAWTLQVGRRAFEQRRAVVCRDAREAAELLEAGAPPQERARSPLPATAAVAFLLPGGGAQYPRMALDLYEREPIFREQVDRGLALLGEREGIDLRPLLFPPDARLEESARELQRPSLQLPALFLVEYALARLWTSWGVQPSALVGHSMGENTAACLAGVMSFEDCLGLVALRGRLFETVPSGGMLSVPLSGEELQPLLGADLDLAVHNAPDLSVASGPSAALEELARRLAERDVDAQRVKIDIAAHSRMLDPILPAFGAYLRSIELRPPEIPFVSNTTGTWITEDEATDPDYWVRHLRSTVRFSQCVETLLEDPGRVLLEVGPGRTLSSLSRMSRAMRTGVPVEASLRHPEEAVDDQAFVLGVLGRLWASGVPVDWAAFHGDEHRRRLPLPTYAFQHQRFWIEPGETRPSTAASGPEIAKQADLEDWFYASSWSRVPIPVPEEGASHRWLVFVDGGGIGARVARRLRERGDVVVTVREGDGFYRVSDEEFALAPEEGRAGYDALLGALAEAGQLPDRVVHLWTLAAGREARPGSSFYHHIQERGFFSLLFLAQALGDQDLPAPLHVTVVTNGAQPAPGGRVLYPEKATLLGPCKVIPQELPGATCALVDVALPQGEGRRRSERGASREHLAECLGAEVLGAPENAVVAWRGDDRFREEFVRARPEPLPGGATRLREGGTYLVTGGLGGLGQVVAAHLARTCRARLILVGRSPLPEREDWESWLATHGPGNRVSRKIRRLLALREAGAEIEVVAADVADLGAMQRVVERGRQRFGAIHGVFHAAGILDDELIQLKTQTAVDELFAPKIQGTLVLDRLLGDDPDLDFMALFSSTSTALGAAGQVDYVAANAFLNAFAHAHQSESGRPWVVALNWGVWNEVGMAAEAAAASDGAGLDELEPEPAAHPLLDGRVAGEDGGFVFFSEWEPQAQWVLDEHRTAEGHAVLPGTGVLELMRAAFAEATGSGPCELRDVVFMAPLAVPDGRSRIVRTTVQPDAGDWTIQVESRPGEVALGAWTLHAEGRAASLGGAAPAPADRDAIAARCALRSQEDADGIRTGQEAHLRFGPRWRCLRSVAWGRDEALARLELPDAFADEAGPWGLHPALLDLATGFAMELIEGYAADALWVPLSYGRVRVHGPLPARLFSHVRIDPESRAQGGMASFDVTLFDDEGRVRLEALGFSIRRLAPGAGFGAAPEGGGPAAAHGVASLGAAEGLSPAERAFRRNLQAGILPEEGARALERVMGAQPTPQILVSSIDMDALIEQVRAGAPHEESAGTRFARPALDSSYVAPRDDLESGLVELFEELLGVDQVGVQDDFFALGGHSLIAVRLFGQIKRRYQVEYPISVLFDAPTVEKVAALIRAETGDEAGESPAVHRPDYRFLVPMHAAEDSGRMPFFLVAGMFGNVLNLRHLAGLLGRDRPFYAVQARGLRGDEAPHESFPEAAHDYLEEIRRVQPHGPYALGGFSGGGITAYEIAQQLRAAGEEVALLVLLDTPLAHRPDRLSPLDKLRIHSQRLARRGPAYLAEWVRRRIEWERRRRAEPEEAGSRPYEFRSQEIEAAFYRALARYETAPWPGAVTLYRPETQGELYRVGGGRTVNEDREFVYPDNGWHRFAEEVRVHLVPGDHDSMVLEPNVRVLAASLREALEQAERAEPEGGPPRGAR